MTFRSLLAAPAAVTSVAYPLTTATAADQVEIVLTGAVSARGLGGNDVCRVHMKIKNRTAFWLEKLTFALHFPGLATPALTERLPWRERMHFLVSGLKLPTVYDNGRDALIAAIKPSPDAAAIQPPGDFWRVIGWLANREEVGLATPPRLAR